MNEVALKENAHELSPFSDTDSFQKIFDIGKMFASSQLIPQNYQGKPMDCVIAVDIANRMGVSPMMVMQNLYIVKGKPVWSGQACMSMIRASREFKNVRVVYTGERGTDSWGCYIQAQYRDTGEMIRGTEVTIRMAKAEKWYSKKDRSGNETSKWQTMPEQMLAYRAAAFFARVYIPNSLMGVYVEGEPGDIAPAERQEARNPFEDIPSDLADEVEEIFK
jgi:hypothetical protein